MKHNRIYLVGFMGAGKSTVGRRLARALGCRFIDLDKEIEHGERRSIAEIFAEGGEPRFREIERSYLKDVSKAPKAVIALGGGAFADAENRAVAENSGLTVWLKVSFAKACTRVRMDGTRPMFSNRQKAEQLLQKREPFYAMAKLHIATDDENVQSIADEIAGVVRGL